jgi:hypothetical protein
MNPFLGPLPPLHVFLRPPKPQASGTAFPHLKDDTTRNLAVHPVKSHGALPFYINALLVRSVSVTCGVADSMRQAQ